jgi:hypothetical protein
VLDRVLSFGDEWMPNRTSDDRLIARIDELNARAAERGRSAIAVTLVGPFGDPGRIERLENAGVHRIVSWLPPRGPAEVEDAFDRFEATAREFATAAG